MKNRFQCLDILRGFTIISMVFFHTMWDLVYLCGIKADWYLGKGAYVWQQSICWTFILLSGFCFSIGRRHLKRGLMVFGSGVLVTVVTLLFTPDQRILFGVLTLIGSCMLILIPLEKPLKQISPVIGLIISILLFFMTRNINYGNLGFEGFQILALPHFLYEQGYICTYLGFMMRGFFSTDYFSLFPWLFLYIAGFYLYQLCNKLELLEIVQQKYRELPASVQKVFVPFAYLGRQSLLIYLLHQPVIYLFAVMIPSYL